MIFKIFVVTLLLFVIFSLGSAMFYMIKDKGQSDKMLKALTWRIGLSVFIFILLLLGQYMGLINPHSL